MRQDERARHQDCNHAKECAKAVDVHPCHKHHAEDDGDHHHRRAEIRLNQQKTGKDEGNDEQLHHRPPCGFQLGGVAVQEGGGVENHRQLDDFAHLQVKHAQVEPAARAIDRETDARDVDEQQQDEGKKEQFARILVEQAVGRDKGDPGAKQAKGVIAPLTEGVVVEVAVVVDCLVHRGRSNHHHADGNQRRPGKKQPDIGKFQPMKAAHPLLAVVIGIEVAGGVCRVPCCHDARPQRGVVVF